VVVGGSVAGLLAAAALSPHSRRVLVVERDRLPDAVAPRAGTPHATHSHGLLSSGRAAMESLLPGLTAELVGRGAVSGADAGSIGAWWIGGGLIADCELGVSGMAVSRLLLESVLRERVRALPGVAVHDGVDVLGLTAGPDGDAVTGVRVLDRGDGARPRTLDADLVVDASGRLGRAGTWFPEHGWPVPEEDVVAIDLRYVTTRVPARPDDLGGRVVAVVAATADVPRGGVALRQEGGSWTVTLFGYVDQQPPLDPDRLRAWARTVGSPVLADLLADRPLERPHAYRFTASRRRRFERLRTPPGYVAIGDALCSFDPAFGQGMSVAALQAGALAEEVARGEGRLEARFHRRAAAVVDGPWVVTRGADLQLAGVRGRRPAGHRAISSYVRRVQRVARRDPVVAAAFMRVVNLAERPASLMTPAVAVRVFGARRAVPAGAR
jgi:2-polyprenyl-6-methoxyphenol hydroxylase-like FAD-dependent oxidoreductase